MTSFAKYMSKLQELTQKNLDILTLLNDSLYSKQLHNEAIIGGTKYSIPSYIYIENKLNDLEGNWRRLVNAPRTGQAAFVFDGNTQRIQVCGFENSPIPVDAKRDDNFYVENNDIFKDFVSPLIYLKYNLSELPEDINTVSVRKIAIHNESIFNTIKGLNTVDWAGVNAALTAGVEDVDYEIYDKVYNLPVKMNDVSGVFGKVGSELVSPSESTVVYDIKLDNIHYTYNNGCLERELAVDDFIITDTDRCILKITDINVTTKTVRAEVFSGYENLASINYFKIWKNQDFSSRRFIKVPLEEDRFIVIFIAPINSNLNIQAAWGIGQVIDTNELTDAEGNKFRDIYNGRIRNVGDVLYDLTKFTTVSLSNIGEDTLKEMTSYKPVIGSYSVELLNDHLLDNSAVDFLRKLNVQKAQLTNDLQAIQDNIDKINNTLATTDFSNQDVVSRQDLEASLEEFNLKKSQNLSNLNNVINQITIASESSNLPTSKSKYVIKGGIDTDAIEKHFENSSRVQVIHIDLLYRYKNINKDTSKATTLSDAVTVSNWNKYIIENRQKVASFENGQIIYKFENENEDSTTGRWRTFQIPISQGESVDIFFRVQYDLGFPYVSTYSAWSDITNVVFPEDIIKDTDIENIINNNASDARNISIKQELSAEGVIGHVGDKLLDQDQIYYHRPESIASGFYTEDSKRIISLKEKLFSINNDINSLKESAFGSNFKDLSVVATYNGINYLITPNSVATSVILPCKEELPTPVQNVITTTVFFTLANTNAKYPLNIYSMFPGDNRVSIDNTKVTHTRFADRISDYTGVSIKTRVYQGTISSSSFATSAEVSTPTIVPSSPTTRPSTSAASPFISTTGQYLNQAVYFRNKSIYDNSDTYLYQDTVSILDDLNIIPIIPDLTAIQMNSAIPGDYIELNPGEAITIPVQVKIYNNSTQTKDISKKISFDVWDSPWQDPLTFTVEIIVPSENSGITNVIDSMKNSGYVATLTKPEAISIKKTSRNTSILK